jgi:superfamily II DNA or RNA helicase
MARLGTDDVPEGFEETWEALIELAARPLVPAPLLAAQALEVTRDADWPVRRAAMEALLRRAKSAENEALAAVGVPARGSPFGSYTVARAAAHSQRRKDQRPYAVYLESLIPFAGSCDCPDFLRGSLGLCKHLIAVVRHVQQKQALLAAALSAPASVPKESRLSWHAARPLLGPGDRLLGLRWYEAPTAGAAAPSARAARAHLSKKRVPLLGEHPDAVRANALALESLTAPKKKRGGKVIRLRTPRAALSERAREVARPESQVWTVSERLLLDPKRRHRLLEDLARLIANESSGVAIDPAVRALVAEELAHSTRVQRGRAEAPRLLRQLDSLGRKLYPYQLEGVERFITHGRLLLADDMGLGKTTQAIAACHALLRSKKVRRGLLIVPAALKPQWVREWQATTNIAIASVDGSPESRARVYRQPKTPFLVIGYEQLLKDLSLVHEFSPDVVVLDEAQRIKNYATKTAVYVKSLTPSYRLVLTGTPMENRLEELASVLDWVDDIALTPKWRLEPWHTFREGDGAAGRSGARNLDTLRARMAPCMLRRVRREVLSQLPSRTDTRVPVPMTSEQQSEHDELIQPIAALLATAARRPLRQPEFLKLMSLLTTQRIISNGLGQLRFDEVWPALERSRPEPALLEGLFMPKLTELRRIIRDVVLEQGRKVVVFSQWRRMLRLAAWSLGDVLADAGHRAVFFTGAESPRQRTQSIVEFHDDPKTSVMLLSDAGGVGLNLQRAASACVNLELPWNPAVVEQRIGRIHRLGQKSPIDVYNLVTEQGIESRIAVLIATKKALFGGLFDGATDSVRFEGQGSFLSDVEKLVAPLPDLPAGPALAPSADDETDAAESSTGADSALDRALADALPSDGSVGKSDAPSTPIRSGEPTLAVTRIDRPKAVAELLRALQVTRAPDGAVTICASPHAADALLSLLHGLTELVETSAASSG